MSKWADRAKTAQGKIQADAVDPDALDKFIKGATADAGFVMDEGDDLVTPPQATQPPPAKKKEAKKAPKPIGRPKVLGETERKQFDVPVELVTKLKRLAAERFGDNQTKALIAVLEGRAKL